MAEFIFTGPNGEKYKVTGDTEAGAALALQQMLGGPKVIATTPDGGRFVEGENGVSFTSPGYSTSDPETVKRLMEGDSVKQVVQSTTDQLTIAQNPVAARANEFVRGAPFVGSYADEAVGLFSPTAGEAMRQSTEAMQREKPGQTAALNMAGAIGFGAPVAAAAAPSQLPAWWASASPAVKAAIGAGTGLLAGGTEGAIYGAGEGTTKDERLANAKKQGAIGAGMAGVLGLAAPLVSPVISSLIKKYKGSDVAAISRELGVSSDAARMLKTAFQNNDQTAVDRILRAGQEATLADAGRSGQALMDAAAQTGGEALNIVDDAVTSRLVRSQQGAGQALDAALGPVRGPIQAAKDIAESSRPARKAAYDAAYATPIDYSSGAGRAIEDALDMVPSDLLQKAIKEANDEMQSLGLKNMQIMAQVADDGSVRFVEMPNVRQMDELKKALDRLVKRDEWGRVAPEGVRPSRLAGQVKAATVDATGGPEGTYARALKVGGDKIAEDNALRLGRDIFKANVTRDEFIQGLADMSTDARAMAKSGVRSQVDDMLARAKSTLSDTSATAEDIQEAKKVIKLFLNRDAREKMVALLGPNQAKELYKELDVLGASFENAASVAQNSKTGIRTAIRETGQDVLSPGPFGTLARGKPIEGTQRLAQFLLSTTPEDDAARAAEMWTEIARVLSEKRGSKSATAALGYVEKAMSGQPLKDAERQLILNQIGVATPLISSRTANTASR